MEELPWFEVLPAAQRADVGLVVQAGLAVFTAWLRDPSAGPPPGPEVFAVAPSELARQITLKQTVQLIRIMVEVVEEQVPALAAPGDAAQLAEHVLRYSREIAFGAAEVYASAAESRGAWDARVETGLVDALVRGRVGEVTASRAASLGWGRPDWVTALVSTPADEPAGAAAGLRAQARHDRLSVLIGEAGGGLVVVVGGAGQPGAALERLAAALPEGPVVTGPVVDDLLAASSCVREALAGLAAVGAWPDAPRPVPCAALLAERAVLGDPTARARLLAEVHAPLAAAGGDLLRTAAAYLDCGTSVEATGRALFLHPNTVRYRLRKVVDAVGRDLSAPRDAQVVRVALVLGRASALPVLDGPDPLP
jgi:PucR C-terminal helix-turn-helix domain/GGDEF-like domain